MHKTIFTIGHSTRTTDEIIDLLNTFGINQLLDVRSFPGSRRCPWFGKEAIKKSLEDASISYLHLPNIGGRRYQKDIDENHAAWREAAFRNYASYAANSEEFQSGLKELLDLSDIKTSAIMCSEAVWWRCHRRIITDYLIHNGCEVRHILSQKNCPIAEMTEFAKPSGPIINYPL